MQTSQPHPQPPVLPDLSRLDVAGEPGPLAREAASGAASGEPAPHRARRLAAAGATPRRPIRRSASPAAGRTAPPQPRPTSPAPRASRTAVAPATLLQAAESLRRVLGRHCELFTSEGAEEFMQRGRPCPRAFGERLEAMTRKLGVFLVDRGEAASAFVAEVDRAMASQAPQTWRRSPERPAVMACIRAAQRAMRRDTAKLESMAELLGSLPRPIAVPREQKAQPPTLPLFVADPFCRLRRHIVVHSRADLDVLRAAIDRLIGLAENFQQFYAAPLQSLAASLMERDNSAGTPWAGLPPAPPQLLHSAVQRPGRKISTST